MFFKTTVTFVIGAATIAVDRNCYNCGWNCDSCGYLQHMWLVSRQLWLIATIVADCDNF